MCVVLMGVVILVMCFCFNFLIGVVIFLIWVVMCVFGVIEVFSRIGEFLVLIRLLVLFYVSIRWLRYLL